MTAIIASSNSFVVTTVARLPLSLFHSTRLDLHIAIS
jgi:hypothetical protein